MRENERENAIRFLLDPVRANGHEAVIDGPYHDGVGDEEVNP